MYIAPVTPARPGLDRRAAAERAAIPLAWIVAALAGGAGLTAALLADARIALHPFTPAATPTLVWLALTFGTFAALRGATDPRRRAVAEGALHYGLFSILTLIGAIVTYPVAAFSRGWVDGTLQSMDAAMRFDWIAWYQFVVAHPWLQVAEHSAYQSVFLSPAILLGWFAATGRRADARRFIATFWLAAAITIALFGAMPAEGPFATLWHRPIPYMPDSGLWQPELIPALRHHALHAIDMGELRGLVSAPSFHTAAAVLYIATAWGVRRLRWPLLALNAAMLLSTPVEGTHYLSDMLMGALVAAVALTAIAALCAFREAAVGRAHRLAGA